MIFRPINDGSAIIIELKVNDTPKSAIQHIIDKNYVQEIEDNDEILLVGINYNTNSNHPQYKHHQVKII